MERREIISLWKPHVWLEFCSVLYLFLQLAFAWSVLVIITSSYKEKIISPGRRVHSKTWEYTHIHISLPSSLSLPFLHLSPSFLVTSFTFHLTCVSIITLSQLSAHVIMKIHGGDKEGSRRENEEVEEGRERMRKWREREDEEVKEGRERSWWRMMKLGSWTRRKGEERRDRKKHEKEGICTKVWNVTIKLLSYLNCIQDWRF